MRLLKKIPHILQPKFLKVQLSAIDDVAQRHFSSSWKDKSQVYVYPLAMDYVLNIACQIFLNVEDREQVRRFGEPFHCGGSGLFSIPIDFPGTRFDRELKAAQIISI